MKAGSVEIQNPVSQYIRDAKTDDQGKFEFDNVPYNNYHLSVTATSFQGAEQDFSVRSPVPLDVKFTLQIGTEKTSLTVNRRRGSGRDRLDHSH